MSFEILGLTEFLGALGGIAGDLDLASQRAVVRGAALIEDKAKKDASGAPGPEVETGTMRRGIRHTRVHRVGFVGWQTEVGPTVIYSRRIELGFHGTDAIGRSYQQEAKPYFEPAWDSVSGQLLRIYAEEWRKGLTAF